MLHGNVAIVTGSGRGIGKAIANDLIKNGAKVVVADLCNAGETASEIGTAQNALGYTVDISKVQSIYEMIGNVKSIFGSVDILVNNAGICPTTPPESITEEEWDNVLAVNLKSAFFCSQVAAELMKIQKYGRIINISSTAGRAGSTVSGCHYSASKAALLGLTKSLAKLWGPYNITVNAIAPGPTMTEMTKDWSTETKDRLLASIPLHKFGHPDYIAGLVSFLASEPAQWITGTTIDVNGGMYMF